MRCQTSPFRPGGQRIAGTLRSSCSSNVSYRLVGSTYDFHSALSVFCPFLSVPFLILPGRCGRRASRNRCVVVLFRVWEKATPAYPPCSPSYRASTTAAPFSRPHTAGSERKNSEVVWTCAQSALPIAVAVECSEGARASCATELIHTELAHHVVRMRSAYC